MILNKHFPLGRFVLAGSVAVAVGVFLAGATVAATICLILGVSIGIALTVRGHQIEQLAADLAVVLDRANDRVAVETSAASQSSSGSSEAETVLSNSTFALILREMEESLASLRTPRWVVGEMKNYLDAVNQLVVAAESGIDFRSEEASLLLDASDDALLAIYGKMGVSNDSLVSVIGRPAVHAS